MWWWYRTWISRYKVFFKDEMREQVINKLT
jgi:hypothetical protein